MAMQINGNYDHSRTDYAERVKEKQEAERAEKAKEAGRETAEKGSGKSSEPQDEYISSEKSERKPSGLYRIGQDENGNRKIYFDDPNKAGRAGGREEPKADEGPSREGRDGKEPKAGGNNQAEPEKKCVGNTDAVDREIKKLKEKKRSWSSRSSRLPGMKRKPGSWRNNWLRSSRN